MRSLFSNLAYHLATLILIIIWVSYLFINEMNKITRASNWEYSLTRNMNNYHYLKYVPHVQFNTLIAIIYFHLYALGSTEWDIE